MTQKLRRHSFGGVIFSGTHVCNFMSHRKPETNNKGSFFLRPRFCRRENGELLDQLEIASFPTIIKTCIGHEE